MPSSQRFQWSLVRIFSWRFNVLLTEIGLRFSPVTPSPSSSPGIFSNLVGLFPFFCLCGWQGSGGITIKNPGQALIFGFHKDNHHS
ncbi:hypothetical protein MRB53_023445 [Persea americana]|uniref:Uncharacterized protein n=1 Tax=Persea americana TaxID=3435 RepID=A0ACC2LAM0_PERAE|nr:hypothetical protein MRB53_023445 [Persea americana]